MVLHVLDEIDDFKLLHRVITVAISLRVEDVNTAVLLSYIELVVRTKGQGGCVIKARIYPFLIKAHRHIGRRDDPTVKGYFQSEIVAIVLDGQRTFLDAYG